MKVMGQSLQRFIRFDKSSMCSNLSIFPQTDLEFIGIINDSYSWCYKYLYRRLIIIFVELAFLIQWCIVYKIYAHLKINLLCNSSVSAEVL